jgi:2-keto-4-pentenoate hydratase/2-oxohepta-3-ene-1,7-dioic acid hydratase in catechol pathway
MRLLNFCAAGDEIHLGVVRGDHVLDLTLAAGRRPEFSCLSAWLRAGEAACQQTDKLLGKGLASMGEPVALSTLRHAPLVGRDSRIFCVGLSYADHAAENNIPPPSSPIFFSKLSSVVIPDGTAIPLPAASDQIDYEAEMAVVLGGKADCVSEAKAAEGIAGYTIMNDDSARDLQRGDKQWFRGKNCNGLGPLGPWLVTADEVGDAGDLEITLRLNGQVRQHSNTR